jgi:ribose-phosphate pyrophosphokinase
MELFMLLEILNRNKCGAIYLVIPYFPYARQDRVTEDKCAFSLKVFCNLLNSQLKPEDKVVMFDPHSDVTPALCDNAAVIPTLSIVEGHFYKEFGDIDAFIAPDAGAYKKVSGVAMYYGKPVIVATKTRNVTTGELSDPKVHGQVPERVIIVDDICDGGRTFTSLAKVLRDAGAKWVGLYVTHGIFSKGVKVFDGLIDHIYTTDTFLTEYSTNPPPNMTVRTVV